MADYDSGGESNAGYLRRSLGPMTAEKRASHNATERQRRETLNSKFRELADRIPTLASKVKPSKGTIIQHAHSYIQYAIEQIRVRDEAIRVLVDRGNHYAADSFRMHQQYDPDFNGNFDNIFNDIAQKLRETDANNESAMTQEINGRASAIPISPHSSYSASALGQAMSGLGSGQDSGISTPRSFASDTSASVHHSLPPYPMDLPVVLLNNQQPPVQYQQSPLRPASYNGEAHRHTSFTGSTHEYRMQDQHSRRESILSQVSSVFDDYNSPAVDEELLSEVSRDIQVVINEYGHHVLADTNSNQTAMYSFDQHHLQQQQQQHHDRTRTSASDPMIASRHRYRPDTTIAPSLLKSKEPRVFETYLQKKDQLSGVDVLPDEILDFFG
eukprot:Partr_v1_DN26793_c0_g1_i2_m8747